MSNLSTISTPTQSDREYVFVPKESLTSIEDDCKSFPSTNSSSENDDLEIEFIQSSPKYIENEIEDYRFITPALQVSTTDDDTHIDTSTLSMEASTIVMKHDGYTEAISTAQQLLDSRLLAYSQYQKMAQTDKVLLTPLCVNANRSLIPSSTKSAMITPTLVLDRPVTVCMGWQQVAGVDRSSRELLQLLEEDGVAYMPHDTAYSVKYLAPVAPFGDCLFLTIEQLLLHSEECQALSPHEIRQVATKHFLQHYKESTKEQQDKIDTAIKNLYFPDLKRGWGVSQFQTRRYVAKKCDRDFLVAKTLELKENYNYSDTKAKAAVYHEYTTPVTDISAYCAYMSVGNEKKENEYFLISMNYSEYGLQSVDVDLYERTVAWGDDFVLEALATAYHRDIFVVLVGCGKMFFLPHRPREEKQKVKGQSKGNAPWFLLMRLTGSDRGGDHYEPMLCERLRGDGADEFGCIGD